MLTVITRDSFDAAANLAYEEALFNDARANPRSLLLFYVNDPCVVLGRANPEAQWVNLDACAADGVPVLRRFSGGGTVYHDQGNLNYSFILPRELLNHLIRVTRDRPGQLGWPTGPDQASAASLAQQIGVHAYIHYFRSLIIRALTPLSDGFSETGLSDISLHGRKVSGNAQRIASSVVLHHGTLLLRCPLEQIERYLPVPPNRPGVPHRGFVGGLSELGLNTTLVELRELIAAEFRSLL